MNRTAMRQIGANFLGVDPKTGAIVGSQIAQPVGAFTGIGQATPNPTAPGRSLNGAVAQSADGVAVGQAALEDEVLLVVDHGELAAGDSSAARDARAGDLAVVNLHPRSGEPPLFLGSPSNIPLTEDYAVVALMRIRIRETAARDHPAYPPKTPGATPDSLFDAVLHGEPDELVAPVQLQLAQDVADVSFYRLFADD